MAGPVEPPNSGRRLLDSLSGTWDRLRAWLVRSRQKLRTWPGRLFRSFRAWWRRFSRGQVIYFAHIIGLIAPGEEMPVHNTHQIEQAPLTTWSEADLEHMIDEGQRQLDRQFSDLERIRGRAQWLLTTGAAITAALGTALVAKHPSGPILLLWVAALALLGFGVAGAAAVMTVRADFMTIDTAVLSRRVPPISRALATSYSRMLRTGENTVNTRLSLFRQAVVYVIVGGYLGLVAALLHHH